MASSSPDDRHEDRETRRPPVLRATQSMVQSSSAAQRLRNEGEDLVGESANENQVLTVELESWVEIASQPSSSSLSSIGDEIVTTGLRVQQESLLRRRRRSGHGEQSGARGPGLLARQTSTSSQEEYDESESEEDHVLTSSNEHIPSMNRPSTLQSQRPTLASDSDGDEDDRATALGRRPEDQAFTPQPNAFSHPPASASHSRQVPGSYFPRSTPHSNTQQRRSYQGRSSRTQHSPFNAMSPAHQADHDAALRASLTTLLSCAAAARGLPKRSSSNLSAGYNALRPEVSGLRLVPESEVTGVPAETSRPRSPVTRASTESSLSAHERDLAPGKRKALTNTKSTSQSRSAKKKKLVPGEETMISPTLLTWVVSAGVVVLVSIVGFGAGYAIGREVGRQEAFDGLSDGVSCGKELMGGTGELRKFRLQGSRIVA